MKTLCLIFHQMKKMFRDHKVFSILLISAQLLGIIILLYSAATIQSISVKQKKLEAQSLIFTVNTLRFTDEMIETEIGYEIINGEKKPTYGMAPKPDYSSCTSYKETMERLKKVFNKSHIKYEAQSLWMSGAYNGKSILTNALGDSSLKKGEITLNKNIYSNYKEGDDFQLGEKTLKVKEIADIWPDMIVAPSDIPDEWLSREITITYNFAPTTTEAEEMKNLLIEAFNCDDIQIPDTIDPLTAQFNSMAIICTLIMLIAILLNVCYAQLYRFKLAKHSFAIFRLVGGKVYKICFMCYVEILFISLLLYATGTAIFNYLLKGTVSSWYEGADSLYTINYYLLFGGAYLLFQLVLISLPLKRFIGREVVVSEREAK